MAAGLVDRYRDRLSLEAGDPVVTLNEGSTPLIEAPRLSERIGAKAYFKFEGLNPTGSFKDRGMTVAVSRAKGRGAAGSGDRPRGEDRDRQARAGADARRPRRRPAGELRRCAADRPRALPEASDRARQLGQPAPDRRPEDGRLRGGRGPRRRPGGTGDPGRQRRQRHRLLAWL